MSIFKKVLTAGEGKKIKALEAVVPRRQRLEEAIQALSTMSCGAKTGEFSSASRTARTSTTSCPRPSPWRGRPPRGHRAASLRRPADGWGRAPLRLDRRDEDR